MNEKEAFLAQNGYYLSAPAGRSMYPFIRGGKDLVSVVLPTRALRRLDAVLYYRKSGEHVIHRIVGKRNDVYLIRGDNCYYTEKVQKEQVVGIVDCVWRDNKKKIEVERHLFYRCAVWLWHVIYPIRYAGSLLRRVAGKIRRFLKERTR